MDGSSLSITQAFAGSPRRAPLRPYLWCWGTLLAVPWVFPFSFGPSPSVAPWLASLMVGGLLVAGHALAPLGRRDFVTAVLWAWVAAALANGLLGAAQYAGLLTDTAAWTSPSVAGQAYGYLRQRNQFAQLMVIGLAAVLALERTAGLGRAFFPMVAFLCAANALSASRIGALGVLLACGLALAWSGGGSRRLRGALLLSVVAYGAASALAPGALMALRGTDVPSVFGRIAVDSACGSRLVLWDNVLELIGQHPWLGWGAGELDYAHYVHLYRGARFCDILDNAHNLPLHLAVELGVPLALAACLGLAWWVWRRAPWREAEPARQAAWTVLAAIALHSLVEYPLWYGPFELAVVLCLVLLRDEARPAVHRVVLVALALLMCGAALYAAWDYRRVSQVYLPYGERDAASRDDPIGAARGTWLFADQLRFAEVTTTPVSRATAAQVTQLASALLHYSPEPKVVQMLVESLVMQRRDAEAAAHMLRFRAAFPVEFKAWLDGADRVGAAGSSGS